MTLFFGYGFDKIHWSQTSGDNFPLCLSMERSPPVKNISHRADSSPPRYFECESVVKLLSHSFLLIKAFHICCQAFNAAALQPQFYGGNMYFVCVSSLPLPLILLA